MLQPAGSGCFSILKSESRFMADLRQRRKSVCFLWKENKKEKKNNQSQFNQRFDEL